VFVVSGPSREYRESAPGTQPQPFGPSGAKERLRVRDLPHAPITVFRGQLAGLLHPNGELSFVELVVLIDVELEHFLLLGLAQGNGT
jgi:hypothetical protein